MWYSLDSRSTHLPFLYVSLFVQDGDFCLYFVTAVFFVLLCHSVCVCVLLGMCFKDFQSGDDIEIVIVKLFLFCFNNAHDE